MFGSTIFASQQYFRALLPPKMSVEWLGVAGFRIQYEDYSILIDPYFTRVSFKYFLNRNVIESNAAKVKDSLQSSDKVILVGHSHFDHVLDVPQIMSQRPNIECYGSYSTLNLLKAAGIEPTRSHLLSHGLALVKGPFEIDVIASKHSPFFLGKKVPFPGDISDCCDLPLDIGGYRCGDVYNFRITVPGLRILHIGSAEFREDLANDYPADIALVCVSGRHFTPEFEERLIRCFKMKVIIPMHYDNFFLPLTAKSAVREFPLMNLGNFARRCQKVDYDMKIETLPALAKIRSYQNID